MTLALHFILRLIMSLLFNSSAEILFAGDAMQHSAQIEAARTASGRYNYNSCFEPLRAVVQSADYAVVNLETPLGGAPYRGYPCFCAPDSYAAALKRAGFDMMLTANNHTLDCRDRGLRRTVAVLDSLGVDHLGTYASAADRERSLPLIRNIKGFKVGFLNYTYGTNGFTPGKDVVVDYIDPELIEADVARTRKAGAEIVCVALHWGEEYQLLPTRAQRSLADRLERLGVDIIFGGHPHVIQPMEMRYDSVTGHRTAVIYSLGNFISNMKTRDTRGGAIAHVTLRRDSLGKAYVDSLSYSLIFTTPGAPGRNFTVCHAADSVPPTWRTHRNAFVKAAEEIFNRHNVNVSRRR